MASRLGVNEWCYDEQITQPAMARRENGDETPDATKEGMGLQSREAFPRR